MRRYRQQRNGRRISLHRPSGRCRQHRSRFWSPRPEPRPHYHSYADRTPSPDKKPESTQSRQPRAKTLLDKERQRERSSDDSSTDSAPEHTYYEQADIADGFHSIALSPDSPPEYEKGLRPVDYVPRSPVYPPPDVFSEVSDEDPLQD